MDRAEPGDRLVLPAGKMDAQPLVATVIEVCGKDGSAPYLVRWEDLSSDTGSVTSLLFPCRGTRIERASHANHGSTGDPEPEFGRSKESQPTSEQRA